MCGRFTITFTVQDVEREFEIDEVMADWNPNYNVAPTQQIPIIMNEEGKHIVDICRWGFIPHWAKDEKIGYSMINARAETVFEKASFRQAIVKNRCLILASGFYEWKRVEKKKKPYYITVKGRKVISFAGIWSYWTSADGKTVRSCSIMTTTANELMSKLHDRMPIILPKESQEKWLEEGLTQAQVSGMLIQYPPKEMEMYEVSPLVNSVRNNGEELLKKI